MVEIKNLVKTFYGSENPLNVLNNVNITVNDGDIYGIIGKSGAGKSTLIRCINMLERPTSGSVIIDGVDIGTLSDKQLRDERRKISMIFQKFNLFMQRTCVQNVRFPLEISGTNKKHANDRAMEFLKMVGLEDKANEYPAKLSWGQQQRVAIARALITEPKLLLCDEVTSALDLNTTNMILKLIQDINKKLGITVIIITHQMSVVEKICNKVAILDNGTIVEHGEANRIFSNPETDVARGFVSVDTHGNLDGSDNDIMIKVLLNGAEVVKEPLITRMSIQTQIAVNIISASAKTINNNMYGSMILSVSGRKNYETVKNYLSHIEDVSVEEI